MGSCGGLVAVDEPSGVEKEPGSGFSVVSEQNYGLSDGNVGSCGVLDECRGVSVKEKSGCASLGDEMEVDLSDGREFVDDRGKELVLVIEESSRYKEPSAGDIGVEDSGGLDVNDTAEEGCCLKKGNVQSCEELDKSGGISAKENSVCVSRSDEVGVHLSNVSDSSNERDKEEVFVAEKMHQHKEPSAGDSGVEDAGRLDANITVEEGCCLKEGSEVNVQSCELLDKCSGVSANANCGCASRNEETGVHLSNVSILVDQRDKVLVAEKMHQQTESSAGDSGVEDAGGLNANNTDEEGYCLKGGLEVNVQSCEVLDKFGGISAKENSGCASPGDETGLYLANVSELVDERDEEEVLVAEKMHQHKEPSAGDSGVEDAGGNDVSKTGKGCCQKVGSLLRENGLGTSSETSELAQELFPSSVSVRNIVEQDEDNDSCMGRGSVVEDKIRSDVGACVSVLHLQASEIAGESSLKTGCPDHCAQRAEQKDAESMVFFLEKAGVDVKRADSTEIEAGVSILMLQSQGQLISNNSGVIDSGGKYIQKIEQSVEKAHGLSEGAREFPGEKNNTLGDTKAEFSHQASPLGESAPCLKEDSLEITPSYINEKLDIPDDTVRDLNSEIGSRSITEVSGKLENTEGALTVDHVSALKCPGALSSNSQRSKGNKSGLKNQTSRRLNRRRTNRAALQDNAMMETIFKFQRRKRSCLSKLACSSIWGSMDYVIKNFGLGSEAAALQKKDEQLQIAKGRRVSKRCSNKRTGRNKKGSRQNLQASLTPIRLKLKFGKEVGLKGMTTSVQVVEDASDPSIALHDSRKDVQDAENIVNNDTEQQVQLLDESPLSVERSSDVTNVDTLHANKKVDGTLVLCNSAEDIAGNHLETHSDIVCQGPGLMQNVYVDVGTSPDSEVINVNPEAQENARCQEESNNGVMASIEEFASHGEVFCNKRGKSKGKKSSCVGNSSSAGKVKSDKANLLKKSGIKQLDVTNFSTYKNTSSIMPRSKEICAEQLYFVKDTGNEVSGYALTNEGVVEDKAEITINVDPGLSQSLDCGDLPYVEKVHRICNKLKSGKERKGRMKASNAGRSRSGTGGRQKTIPNRVVSKSKMEENFVGKKFACEPESQELDDVGKKLSNENNVHVDASKGDAELGGVVDQKLPPSSAWVSCDDCHKWRRIPPSLLDSIQDCRWVCENNMDQSFASCSIPQEKSNAEINAELGYSDPSCEEDALSDHLKHRTAQHIVRNDPMKEYKIIRTNEFLHRGRKTLNIDEIMVCHCKPPQDGRMGCGDGCLNRMLSIECVKGTCPCGDLCSNQQFQRRQWAKLSLLRCGKKGYGLKSLQNISEGQFLIEYVGEVLDMRAYEDRQNAYAQEGHKHFYFMTLNGGEVIDACKKGNVGRFINHSCEPNCRTEKWMVNGEICIGLFALRDIIKGEELTFDYNYVRVFGAAVKKCYCGASHCQGYIGGDPLESDMVVQDDSDEECSELFKEDEEIKVGSGNIVPISNSYTGVDMQKDYSWKKNLQETSAAVGQLEITTKLDEIMNRAAPGISESQSLHDVDGSMGTIVSSHLSTQSDEAACKIPSSVRQETPIEIAKTNDALYSTKVSHIFPIEKQPTDKKVEPDALEGKQTSFKPRTRVKTSRTSAKLDKYINITSGSKVQVLNSKQSIISAKTKRPVESPACGSFEAVEVKLNLLLDVSGGIKKDAVKGYLKLLLLTAASGDSNNDESIQSNRDLSMILDALLKTKSRTVLTDIINKNGLRMLHNIIKQCRKVFLRIPILRKLMKILEYLSMKGVLTLEHISSGPPCPGMESFRESMLSLTEHVDKQIHQIARNFRDRWIPRPLRKVGCVDKDDSRMDFHKSSKCNRVPAFQGHWHINGGRQNETIDYKKQSEIATPQLYSVPQEICSLPCTGDSPTYGSKTYKRKSRWDQPDGGNFSSQYHYGEQRNGYRVPEQNSFPHEDEAMRVDGEQTTQEDVPPGFSSPIVHNKISSSISTSVINVTESNICWQGHSMEATIGHPQAKFNSRSPVSYGLPISILEQFGTRQNDSVDDWLIAPGIPFSPFPPLPSVPHDKKDHLPSVVNPMITDCMGGKQDGRVSAVSVELIPSSSDTCTPYVNGPKIQHNHKRPRGFACDLGRRYFKQQKGPHTRFGPPWLWKRNEWSHIGNNSRSGSFCTATNGQSPFCLGDEKYRDERAGSNFYQQSQHQNRY